MDNFTTNIYFLPRNILSAFNLNEIIPHMYVLFVVLQREDNHEKTYMKANIVILLYEFK